MAYNPDIHHRRSIRLKGYDYSQAGLYFITICVHNRICLFGNIPVGAPLVGAQSGPGATGILNDAGIMVESEWLKLPERFPNIELHDFVIMPNHFHAILQIVPVGAPLVGALCTGALCTGAQCTGAQLGMPPKTIGDMMDAFKSKTTVEYIQGVRTMAWEPFNGKLWQRNYHDHIIRNEQSYQIISDYITENPAKWANDKLFSL